MSEVIDKIFKTRNVLKEILSKDYITEDIQNFSQSEIVNLYKLLMMHMIQVVLVVVIFQLNIVLLKIII